MGTCGGGGWAGGTEEGGQLCPHSGLPYPRWAALPGHHGTSPPGASVASGDRREPGLKGPGTTQTKICFNTYMLKLQEKIRYIYLFLYIYI